ncbi:MAG TPA: hypothetical protein VHY37_02935, partial [Tepidisphaeraceae bacterium]|nr:hypothetical protein [Tepidisphaeraceae bacterium]
SSGSTSVELFLSADGADDSSATPIQTFTKSLRILPGKTDTLSFRLNTIPSVAAGSYFVVAKVIDPLGQISTAVSGRAVSISPAARVSKPTAPSNPMGY